MRPLNINISHKPIDYEKLNRLSEDFGKCFTPQQELSTKQAFWLHISNPTIESSNKPPVKVEVPSELPKKRTTQNARTEGEWGFEHTKAVLNKEIIPFLKSIKDIFNVFDKDLLNEIMEVQTVFDQIDVAVQQSSVDKQCLEIAKKELHLENDQLLQQNMSQDVLLTVMNSMSLNAQIKDKVFVITSLKNDLQKVKGKEIIDIAAQIPSANTIVPGMFKLDLDPLAPRLLQNREAHIDYLKYTQEQADILRGIRQRLRAGYGTVVISSQLLVTLNKLAKDGKSKKSSHQPKAEDTNQEKLYLLHMDLCGPMRVRPSSNASDNVRTDNGTEFFNQTLCGFYENVGILHQTSVARTPQQNDVVERRNQTLVKAARTMLIFSKASLFLWAEAINTACYTQNRSLIRLRYNKTSYELMQDKKPDLSFFHVFGALCYPTNDNDDLGKLDAKADIGIFVVYAPAKKAFRIYNKRT
ncbi:retrovirus-related pol polyprotein from transposon TNT 1-94 [Tanacetum coccineum]